MNDLIKEAKENGYLFNEKSFNNIKLERSIKEYCKLVQYKSYDIKYAVRTLNNLLQLSDKETLKKEFKEDLEQGSWTIDICNLNNIEEYFEENSLEEIQYDLISFCYEWEV